MRVASGPSQRAAISFMFHSKMGGGDLFAGTGEVKTGVE